MNGRRELAISPHPTNTRAVNRASARLLLPLLALALHACQPRLVGDASLAVKDPACSFAPLAPGLDDSAEASLHAVGRGLGLIAASPRAARDVDIATEDGYRVRAFGATVVLGLGLLGLGALIAALLLNFGLAFGGRRPHNRWSERLARSIQGELEAIGHLARGRDPLLASLISRFAPLLESAGKRSKALLERAPNAAGREDPPTTAAQRDSLDRQLSALLAQLEHLHLHLLAWQERQLEGDRQALEAQVTTVVAELEAAIKATGEAQ
jgi:hypothetical protein